MMEYIFNLFVVIVVGFCFSIGVLLGMGIFFVLSDFVGVAIKKIKVSVK